MSSPQRPTFPNDGTGVAPAAPARAGDEFPAKFGSPDPGHRPAAAAGLRRLWQREASGRTVFRHALPLVLWWCWVVFAVANLIDVSVGSHALTVLKVAAGLVTVTGVMYACTLQSRVEVDGGGITVFNPLRRYRAPWGAVEGVYLGDSVEVVCTRPAPRKAKTVYSWALYSSRRARARSQMQRSAFSSSSGSRRRGQVSPRAPTAAAELARQPTAQVMAAELGRRAEAAREAGTPSAVLASHWSWQPIAAIIGPGVLLLILLQFH